MPIISIIVPAFNVEKYLDRCIKSILAQTFMDFELILVNDGSTDRSGEICDHFAEIDNRIKVIHKTNGGVSSARNAGLNVAIGQYCMFCDGDDYVHPDWCKLLIEKAYLNSTAWIVSNIYKILGGGTLSFQSKTNKLHVEYFDIYKMGLSAYVFNKIYSMEVIKRNNILFDNNVGYGEDVIFNVQYCKQCTSIMYIDKPTYYYVYNENSAMNRYYDNLFELHLPLFYLRIPLIRKENLPEYCDIWLYHFLKLFRNVFDKRCSMSLYNKLSYNQKMLKSKEFRFCLDNASGKNENSLLLKVYKTHNYYLVWIFEKIIQVKREWRK